jgi:hypothetical protein
MADDALPRSDFYVYVIFRPNGVPCYVGKGRGQRDQFHEVKGSHNPHLQAIFKLAGGVLPRIRFREGLTDKAALALEAVVIAAIGREIHGGPLVNQTDGGEGGGGIIRSAETRLKMSKAQRGKKLSTETRLKLSYSQKLVKHTPEWNAKVGSAHKGKPETPETRAKISAAWTAERKAVYAASNVGNAYGLGNKRTPEGQILVTLSVTQSNRRRNKTGKPTTHKGATPWVDEGMSRTSWYRKRANDRARGSETNRGGETPISL